MADILTPEARSVHMARIRGKDTRPEMVIRRGLHARGFRYRLHAALPGKPDLVFPARRAAVFVNGCFWHGHDCPLFRLPGTRPDFWSAKIARNRERDAEVLAMLHASGWRTLTIWECSLRGRDRRPAEEVLDLAGNWLCSSASEGNIRGGLDAGH
ncbi:very short patch repair endonuclease [Sphingopyxis sp. MC1]|uniref:very short patch repair endonuclease n=1 Tax=Sphingopyxis sp. MC1 TaxID=1174684 RepID=UPI0002D1A32C|nr:very short patch repair endonuclease [Sphingopyxis sp. MC1]ENY82809.1 T/G mismatch-specific endonuclease [Sphingopyxis sp. MC1]MBN2973546.1 DNA mismatch endonuclease Vsr [Roseomonas aeriglobus]